MEPLSEEYLRNVQTTHALLDEADNDAYDDMWWGWPQRPSPH